LENWVRLNSKGQHKGAGDKPVTLLCLTNADLFLSNFVLLPKNDSLIRQEIFPVNFQVQYWPARLQAPPGLALRKFGAEIRAGIFHFSLLISLLAGKST